MPLIDVHAHLVPTFYRDALSEAGRRSTISTGFPAWTPESALAAMDENGVTTAILSVSQPGVHFGNDAAARALARTFNTYMAELSVGHGPRFGGFAALPLPDVAGACDEIDYALDVLKLDGVGLFASYGELFLGDDRFDPVLQRLDDRAAVVFVHPNLHPTARELKVGLPPWVVEFTFDTTRAIAGFVLAGKRRRFPRIRFILAHAGGTLPFLAWRIASAPEIDPRSTQLTRAEINSDLASFWFETAQAPGAAVIGALARLTSFERILFGTDWPYCPTSVGKAMLDTLRQIETISATERRALEWGNASALFPRLREFAVTD